MNEPHLSAMLWFRADPARDTDVSLALQRVVRALAADAPVRVGHRHEEDRPYRTWMIDAGPVAPERYQAMLWRLHKAVSAVNLRALAQAPPNLESFEWVSSSHPGEPSPGAAPDAAPSGT